MPELRSLTSAAATAAVKRAADAAATAASALQQVLDALPPANGEQALLLAAVSASTSAAAASASAAAALLAQLKLDLQASPAAAPAAAAVAPAAATPAPAQQQQQASSAHSTAGKLVPIEDGAAELQRHFDASQAPLAIVSWHASWSNHCVEAAEALGRMARQHPGAAFFLLDVEASAANSAFALEKVMGRPESRRIGERCPCLRAGGRLWAGWEAAAAAGGLPQGMHAKHSTWHAC